jgi:hypothetical protein
VLAFHLGCISFFFVVLTGAVDRDIGRRFTMPDIKRMVKADPSMLEGFSKEEEKKMVADIRDKRDRKRRGARANNLAASADAKRTVERLMEEVRALSLMFETREPIQSSLADYGSCRAFGYDRLRNVHPWTRSRQLDPRHHGVMGCAQLLPGGFKEGPRGRECAV